VLTASVSLFLQYFGSGIPGVKFHSLLCCFIFIVFIFIKRKQLIYKGESYPRLLAIASLIIMACYFITDFFASQKATSVIIVNCISFFFFPYVLWHSIKTKHDLKRYIKYLFIFILVVEVYTIIEQIAGMNYYSVIIKEMGLVEGEIMTSSARRFGVKWCNSLLTWTQTLGFIGCVMFSICYILKISDKTLYNNVLLNAVFFLAPFSVLFAASRAMYLIFCIFILCILIKKAFTNFVNLGAVSLLVLIAAFLSTVLVNQIIKIMFTIATAPGSSVEYRMIQLGISMEAFLRSPVWGNGKNYIWYKVAAKNPLIHGAESIVFQTMVDFGLMGCASYMFLIISCMIVLWKNGPLYSIIPFFYLIGGIMTIIMDVDLDTVLVFTVLLLKVQAFKEASLHKRYG
jgi:hypothetical protein